MASWWQWIVGQLGKLIVSEDCGTPFRLEHLVKTNIPVTLMCGRVERGVGAGEGCCGCVGVCRPNDVGEN